MCVPSGEGRPVLIVDFKWGSRRVRTVSVVGRHLWYTGKESVSESTVVLFIGVPEIRCVDFGYCKVLYRYLVMCSGDVVVTRRVSGSRVSQGFIKRSTMK